ncbi:MAG: prepilin-type N-terminal cleavage/methylation domain-containing protein [Candidatus Saccharibacteria bacterium]|nr:prepilin-type N-terminal cleavage/methylation domain-containing protein [Candidatus Saccharibacteria bacterium]
MKSNQKGFSVVEILIVVVIVGLVGIVGWLVYDRQNNKTSETPNTQVTANQEEETPLQETKPEQVNDETKDWKEVNNSAYFFSYKYPTTDSCEDFIIETAETSQLYSLGERLNNSGVSCKVSEQGGASPFSVRVAVAGSTEDQPDFGDKQMEGNTYYSLASKTSVENGGASGTKWEYNPGDDSSARIVYYYFKYKDLSYVIVINDNGFKTKAFDVTQRGEKIFETFQFTQ